jgi:hypothetical protein
LAAACNKFARYKQDLLLWVIGATFGKVCAYCLIQGARPMAGISVARPGTFFPFLLVLVTLGLFAFDFP